MPEEKPAVGQIWKRTRGGVLVRITKIDPEWDDVYWNAIESKNRGVLWMDNFKKSYTRVEEE